MNTKPPRKAIKVGRVGRPPVGYRFLTERVEDHPGGKAIRFRYWNWMIWVPARAVLRLPNGTYIVPYNVLDKAKDHDSARHVDDIIVRESD